MLHVLLKIRMDNLPIFELVISVIKFKAVIKYLSYNNTLKNK